MKLVSCIFCLATLVSECLLTEIDEFNVLLKRSKRQNDGPDADEIWSWGTTGAAQTEKPITKSPLTTTTSTALQNRVNPCDYRLLEKPDFNAPGRRVSEIKCYEYIWGIKMRDDKTDKQLACWIYESAKKGIFAAIGGRNTIEGEFPHMAAIGWRPVVGKWIFKCGGSLISPNFVLTAAHCTRASELDTTIADVVPKIVRLGDKNIIDKFSKGVLPTNVNISRIIVHPSYKAPIKYYDIALMELEKAVEFTNYIHPACLWTKADTSPLGSGATLTGWGVVETASRTTSPELQAADVDIIDNGQCDQLLRPMGNRNWRGIQEHQLCAGKLAGGVDACQGDSGGPLQVKIILPPEARTRMHYVIGVTSFGFGCALEDTPGVYTRVSSFIDWIESIVWK